jgi:hypothetical protein
MMVPKKVLEVVIASEAKQSRILLVPDFMGLLRRPAKRGTPRNDIGLDFFRIYQS